MGYYWTTNHTPALNFRWEVLGIAPPPPACPVAILPTDNNFVFFCLSNLRGGGGGTQKNLWKVCAAQVGRVTQQIYFFGRGLFCQIDVLKEPKSDKIWLLNASPPKHFMTWNGVSPQQKARKNQPNKQTIKQTTKQTNNQTNNQTNKQTNKQTKRNKTTRPEGGKGGMYPYTFQCGYPRVTSLALH